MALVLYYMELQVGGVYTQRTQIHAESMTKYFAVAVFTVY